MIYKLTFLAIILSILVASCNRQTIPKQSNPKVTLHLGDESYFSQRIIKNRIKIQDGALEHIKQLYLSSNLRTMDIYDHLDDEIKTENDLIRLGFLIFFPDLLLERIKFDLEPCYSSDSLITQNYSLAISLNYQNASLPKLLNSEQIHIILDSLSITDNNEITLTTKHINQKGDLINFNSALDPGYRFSLDNLVDLLNEIALECSYLISVNDSFCTLLGSERAKVRSEIEALLFKELPTALKNKVINESNTLSNYKFTGGVINNDSTAFFGHYRRDFQFQSRDQYLKSNSSNYGDSYGGTGISLDSTSIELYAKLIKGEWFYFFQSSSISISDKYLKTMKLDDTFFEGLNSHSTLIYYGILIETEPRLIRSKIDSIDLINSVDGNNNFTIIEKYKTMIDQLSMEKK